MGCYTVGEAITKLHAKGIRAQRGYPGILMPHLTGAVVAVNVHKEEPGKTTLAAKICAPMNMGVYACEDLAAKVAVAWAEDGGLCTYGDHGFDGKSGIYSMTLLGTWVEVEEENTEETTEETA